MMALVRALTRFIEICTAVPMRLVRLFTDWVAFNPRLGPLRYVFVAAALYVVFAFVLVYVVAPIRGMVGQTYLSEKLRYDAERWLATAIYDSNGDFAGTFGPRLDSNQDVNWTDAPIEVGQYVANPDHKSIPVREVPDYYWKCLVYHEDRYVGTWLNPSGIDLAGVLKIPYSTIKRSIALGRPSLGVGGSTLPMQFARVIYKTPPHSDETPGDKLGRKLREWWMAPVIYHELTRGGDDTALKEWAANHLWLAQRTGGSSLHGVEVTSQIVFGKQAKDLSIAEQFVLASAVNKPIILLEGSDRLNAVRIDRWRYIAEVRARICAENLIEDAQEQSKVVFELVGLAGGPPDPQVKPKLQAALEFHAPDKARRAQANPIIRAETLMPDARFGIREEMKHAYGFDWRRHVRGVTTTFDAAENLSFHSAMISALGRLDKEVGARIDPGWTLNPEKTEIGLQMPNVIVAAADAEGNIVRFFDYGQLASYFGSISARDGQTGSYDAKREGRMLASTAKIMSAIAIANQGTDTVNSLYVDANAPAKGLETCARRGNLRRGRKAVVAFACSLNDPLMRRTARAGQVQVRQLIDGFGFNMPPAAEGERGTPPSTAVVLGQVSGSPQRVHRMAGVVLASLLGRDQLSVKAPSLVRDFDYTNAASKDDAAAKAHDGIVPAGLIERRGKPLLRALLQAPFCYQAYKTSHGTLKSLADWCAARRNDLRLNFAKSGTQVTIDPDATVDGWIAGGMQFTNGAAYSYVVVVGTGSTSQPWARSLHASQLAAPLLRVLFNDLKEHSRTHPRPDLLPAPPQPKSVETGTADVSRAAAKTSAWTAITGSERERIFSPN